MGESRPRAYNPTGARLPTAGRVPMPIYEYDCPADGTVIELIRPADQADDPVPDPEGRGRVFRRRLSAIRTPAGDRSLPASPGFCPCGRERGACGQS
jgi:hypothetical protein